MRTGANQSSRRRAGAQANLVVLDGDPSRSIAEIRKVETVFRAGVGYASRALIEAVRGRIGIW